MHKAWGFGSGVQVVHGQGSGLVWWSKRRNLQFDRQLSQRKEATIEFHELPLFSFCREWGYRMSINRGVITMHSLAPLVVT